MGLVLCGCLAVLPSAANGDLIFQGFHPSYPDISAVGLSGNYNGSTGDLTISGWAVSYNRGAEDSPDISFGDDCNYILTATVTHSSTTPTICNGSLTISGTTDGGSDPLLTGTIEQVGYQQVDDISANLDFSFRVTGGSLADAFGGIGAVACTAPNLSFDAPFNGDFHNSFTCSDGNSDTHTVPEPASLALIMTSIMTGLLVSVVRRSWKRRG